MFKYLLLIILAIGFGVGGYFIGFNNGREKEILAKREEINNLQKRLIDNSDQKSVDSNAEVKSAEQTKPPSPDQSSDQNSSTSENIQGEEYTVQDKDTLFTIGLKFDITWEKIAQANGLDENAKLYIGQKLKIPKLDEQNTTSYSDITINQEEATNQQKAANEQGADLWRRDPIEVVRKEAPTDLNLLPGDPYSLLNKDTNLGKATVFLQKDSKSYTFNLIQPVDKGDNGIWKIDGIDTKNNE